MHGRSARISLRRCKVSKPESLGMCMSSKNDMHRFALHDLEGFFTIARQQRLDAPRLEHPAQSFPISYVVIGDQQ